MFIRLVLLIFCLISLNAYSQVENVPVAHPVYNFLKHQEIKGLLPHFSSSALPLSRQEIEKSLRTIQTRKDDLSSAEIKSLNKFLVEFEILHKDNAVVFYSEMEQEQVLSPKMFSDRDKFFYHYKDSLKNVSVKPLGNLQYTYSKETSDRKVLLGNLGVRIFGTVGQHLGYYLQATNGTIFSGDRSLALEDPKLHQNVKFKDLKSDFDFSESHIRYQDDWFFATIGRETKFLGSGISNYMFLSDNAPPMDAFTLGASFTNFNYTFTHGSLVAFKGKVVSGVNSDIPSKYIAMHRFAIKPEWGEIAYWDAIIYSKRGYDEAYLTPIGFFKSIEHALHDRDNSMMGLDWTIRPIKNLQIKGSFLLDDIRFSTIGKGDWGNKTAWNIALLYSFRSLDIGMEYSRIEPYTFSHFDSLNSYTNDENILGSYLLPNSDQISLVANYWYGGRYPLKLEIANIKHGSNIYDSLGNLIKNVGSDYLQTVRAGIDSYVVTFLDGQRQDAFRITFETGWELIRGFSLHLRYSYINRTGTIIHRPTITLRFEDF